MTIEKWLPLFPSLPYYLWLDFQGLSWFHPATLIWSVDHWTGRCNHCSIWAPVKENIGNWNGETKSLSLSTIYLSPGITVECKNFSVSNLLYAWCEWNCYQVNLTIGDINQKAHGPSSSHVLSKIYRPKDRQMDRH